MSYRSPIRPKELCHQRLHRLIKVLDRQGGTETLRQLWRRFGIETWEVEQAAEMGWVALETYRPPVGRPSRVARKLSKYSSAKFPPSRRQIGKMISYGHIRFAMLTVFHSVQGGSKTFGIAPHIDSYLKAYPTATSRAGAYACCSRLLRHPDVIAARAWFHAIVNGRLRASDPMPDTAREVWKRLRMLRE